MAVYWLGRRDARSLVRLVAWLMALAFGQFVLELAGTLAFLGTLNSSQVGNVRNLSPYAVSPVPWAILVVSAAGIAAAMSRTRFGWAAAVAFSVLASPRLLAYRFATLLAGLSDPSRRSRTEPNLLPDIGGPP